MNQQKNQHQLSLLKQGRQSRNDARSEPDKGFRWTRRTIALVSILSIICLPIVGGILYPHLPVSYGVTELGGGLFGGDAGRILWTTGTGVVIGPMHTHLVSAIAGMYFGSSAVSDA